MLTPEQVGEWAGGIAKGALGALFSIGGVRLFKARHQTVTLNQALFSKEWVKRVEERLQEYHAIGGRVQALIIDVDITKRNMEGLRHLVEAQQAIQTAQTGFASRIEDKLDSLSERIDRLVDRPR